jgi:hypothetical protein
MDHRTGRRGEYVVPSYQAPDGAPWYHFLHGNVPGHEIDFIYRPDVPQGPLTEQHFSHLARLMKDIEPPTRGLYAFAVCNLSRDDTQHEPGHGGVALLFGLRIHGALDHAGRNDPPFAHAIASIDRQLDPTILLESARVFHQRVLGATGPSGWYPDYVRCATEGPFAARRTLEAYVTSFEDLPPPKPSTMGLKWTSRGARLPKRVVIVHEEDASFESIARCAARIVAMLYQSDLRWTSISNGREADVPNGMSIRFVAQRDLVTDPADSVHQIHEIPEEEAEIAQKLFDARAAAPEERPAMQGWRERYSDKRLPATEDARFMKLGAAPAAAAGADPDELSIDCSSFDTPAPKPAANVSPIARVDIQASPPDDAPLVLHRSRRLLVGSGLAGSALMIALAMAAIPTSGPQEGGAGTLVAPSPSIAASPLEDTAPSNRNPPAPSVNEPGPTQQVAVKPLPGNPRWPGKGGNRSSSFKPGSGSQHSPSQGATAQPSGNPGSTSESVDASASAIFGAPR